MALMRVTISPVQATVELDRAGLRRYLDRVNDRWRLEGAYIGGSALSGDPSDDGSSAEWGGVVSAFYERPAGFTVVLVSDAFAEFPWLERVYMTGALWDRLEMRAPATVQCYTRAEFERKRESSAALRDTIWHGLDLLALI
jgi:hypothetical protein